MKKPRQREAIARRRIAKSLRGLGYWDITQTDTTRSKCICNRWVMTYPPKGRPDVLLLNPTGATIVMEAKAIGPNDTSFAFNNITPEQRKWLDRWRDDEGRGYIGLGVFAPHGKQEWLEKVYLVDWKAWLATEELLKPIQASLPRDCSRARSKEIRERRLCANHLLSEWEMTRYTSELWLLPENHTAHPII